MQGKNPVWEENGRKRGDNMLIVDRIESNTVVVEDGDTFLEIPLEKINGKIHEGDVLLCDGEKYKIDNNSTEDRRKVILDKQKSIFGE